MVRAMCRYGHNELEDPKATLPVSYNLVEKHPSVLQLYSQKLQDVGLVGSSDVDTLQVGHGCNIAPSVSFIVHDSSSSALHRWQYRML